MSSTASSLASDRNRNVGVVVPSVARWYYSQIVDSGAASPLEDGYGLTLYNLNEDAGHRARELATEHLIDLGHRRIAHIGGPLPGAETPTAVFYASDEMAIGTIIAARELGLRVPEDISVIGIDGHELVEALGLTTVARYPHQQGQRAVQRLLEILQDPDAHRPTHRDARTALIIRSRTAAPAV
ncbi:substrate-binding domain-containing protein [Arthrobacter sp. H20]|uniref:substrate-binding domain-containing protein n=1 Tax=Arthrobacter sp. H20 TaxID=1267981 RepID=UPI0006842CDC|nr:substrate-binding domain-containing protein [Arthrobacter sp. H20]